MDMFNYMVVDKILKVDVKDVKVVRGKVEGLDVVLMKMKEEENRGREEDA